MGICVNNEVMLIKLMQFVEEKVAEGLSITQALRLFSHENKLTMQSVKQCFEQMLASLCQHPKLAKRLGVNLEALTNPANKYSAKELFNYVCNNPCSTPMKCMYDLAFGDRELARRLLRRYLAFFTYTRPVTPKRPYASSTLEVQAKYFINQLNKTAK